MSATKLQLLRHAMTRYAELSDSTWTKLCQACSERKLSKGETLVQIGTPSRHLYFVCQGLLRSYTLSADGKEYNKKFFPENTFPGTIRALLKSEASDFALQALEPSSVLAIDHHAYRRLLESSEDLKWYHIQYLETNWVLEKEPIEVGLALSDSTARYRAFIEKHASILDRIPLHHIASAIGVTPTQLSRIRKAVTANI
ncbi:cyclic nucleotide-binding domain-containing protein [Pelagicoccus sp. SDUM812002]|uniref:Crp/Fnr family transcriptional regulator n=1 Tax=Pelagicoccus sp. SDUM812002 TaxID=3041266 RepID=UPI00280ECB09|nr:cyclic nucleotide-binding domain-containing protein [Pelagicoccus sp. SDUM812002]MDQ8187049.1 cyclic nucleotide-binding domain-containing protein [Pelagicoccus sp. SDUM812002]